MNLQQSLEDLVQRVRAPLEPGEIHGLLTGTACAAGGQTPGERQALYANWLDTNPNPDDLKLLEAVFESTADAFWEHSDLDFVLLIPDDEEPLADRMYSLANWCDGFLAGFGGAAGAASLSDDVSEALKDFAGIAAVTDMPEDSEENEQDFMQIVEYVRVSAAVIHAEHARNNQPGRPE